VDAHRGERDDHDGVPRPALDPRSRRPCGGVARVLARLLIARAPRGRLEVVDLRAASARVDPDPDEVVEPEADVVRRLPRHDREAVLLDLKRNVQIPIVEQQVGDGSEGGGPS
jgi:hypothetical protein